MKETTRADYLDRVRRVLRFVQEPSVLCGVHYGVDFAVSQFVALREGSQMIDVRIETLPARRLLAVPHRGSYMGIGDAFTRVFDMAAARGLLTPETSIS